MAQVKFLKTASSNLSSLPKIDGQIILTTDTGKLYIDNSGSERFEIDGKTYGLSLNGDTLSLVENGSSSSVTIPSGGSSNVKYLSAAECQTIILTELEPGVYFYPQEQNYLYIKGSTEATAYEQIGPLNVDSESYSRKRMDPHYFIYYQDFNSASNGDHLLIVPTLDGPDNYSGGSKKGIIRYEYWDITKYNYSSTASRIMKYNPAQNRTDMTTINNQAQTFSGVKTFNSLPECSATPSTNNQLVNKSYVDGIIPDISGKLDTSKVKTSNSTTTGDVYDVTYINTMLGNVESLLSAI